MTKDLTKGRPLGLILGFAIPVLLGMLFQQFYNLVDTMIVGKILGPDALAAVGSTGSLNFMVLGFCNGICTGFAIPMSQAFGARDENALKKYIGNCLWLCIMFAAVMAVATGLLCKPILRLMKTPADILEDAYRYIVIIFWGIPVTYLYNMLSGMIRAVGDSKTPVLFLALASILNIFLDVVLITVIPMGVAGAATATVIAQAVSGIGCLFYIKKKFPILRPAGTQWRADKRYALKLCAMGIPMGLQYSVTAIGSVILQSAVNSLGTLYVASVTTGSKLSLIFCCPFDALGATIATYGGQNVGAGKVSRIGEGVKVCMTLGSVYSLLAFTLFFLAGDRLALLFVDGENARIIANARMFLLCNSLFYIPLAAVNVYRFVIQGVGYSQVAILAGVFEMAARTAVGLLFVPRIGFTAACVANPAAWIAADLFLIPTYIYCMKRLGLRIASQNADCEENETPEERRILPGQGRLRPRRP